MSRKKPTYNHKSVYIVLIASFVIGLFLAVSCLPTRLGSKLGMVDNVEVSPKLKMVEFVSQESDSQTLITSVNYGFEIEFPSFYEIKTGRAFNKYYPENEDVSLGASDPDENSDLVYVIRISDSKGELLSDLVDRHIDIAKQSKFPSRYGEILDSEISLDIGDFVISDNNGIKIDYVASFNKQTVEYFIVNDGLLFNIAVMRNHGELFTAEQIGEIDSVVESFGFLNN